MLPGSPPFLLDALLARTDGAVSEGEMVRLASHQIVLKKDEDRALTDIEKAFAGAGLKVPFVAEVLAKSGVEQARARTLLQILLREKRLIRVTEELVFHSSAIQALRGTLGQRKGRRFSVTDFKEWTGASRKYAIPLLEYLDRERVTRREGDQRIIL
jgi:selenocysteine-specific elongation factor